MSRPLLSSVLIKPAGPACNMACTYCFYRAKQSRFPVAGRISWSTVEAITRQLLDQPVREVTFSWQGGEPTLMGPAFFREALRLQRRLRRPGQLVRNALMTNGLLVDDEWCELFRQGDMMVGLSLDGPQPLHDAHRRRAGGEPSYRQVTKAARRLVDAGVAVNAVAVVSRRSCGEGAAIYGLLKGLGFRHLQLVPCVEPDPTGPHELAPFSVTAEGYGQLLCDLYDCWRADFVDDAPTVSVRWLDGVLHQYVGLPPTECTLHSRCGAYLVVEHDGSVYCCDFFVDDDHCLGNVHDRPLPSLFDGQAHRRFGQSKGRLSTACRECPWRATCQGGCPKDRRLGADGSHALCAGYRRFFEYADAGLVELARRWLDRRQRHGAAAPKVGRNAPCPCGSGKKFKRCCGHR